jgi:hypothetical protein
VPAKSEAQRRFMGMCSSSEGRAKASGKCPPVSVAKEFAHKKLPRKAKGKSLGRE